MIILRFVNRIISLLVGGTFPPSSYPPSSLSRLFLISQSKMACFFFVFLTLFFVVALLACMFIATDLSVHYRDGNYGLYLDSTLTDGSSARCLTFDNEPLCSAGPKQGDSITFECVGLEVWGV